MSPFRSLARRIRDVFDANTEADKRRRIAEGKPAEYRDEVAQRRGVLPKLYGNIQTGFQDDTQKLRSAFRDKDVSKPSAFADFYLNRTGIGGLNKRLYDNKHVGSALEGAGSAIVNSSPQRIVGAATEFAGRALGNKGLENWGQNVSDKFRDFNTQSYDERLKRGQMNRWAYQGGNIGGTLLSTAVNPSGRMGVVARGAQIGLPAGADTSKYIKDAGGSRKAQVIGGGASLASQAVMGNLLRGAGRGSVRIGTAAAGGGAENTAQQLIDNLVAQKTYNSGRKLTEGLVPAFVMGAGISGALSTSNPKAGVRVVSDPQARKQAAQKTVRVTKDAIRTANDNLNAERVSARVKIEQGIRDDMTRAIESATKRGDMATARTLIAQRSGQVNKIKRLEAQEKILKKNLGLSIQPIKDTSDTSGGRTTSGVPNARNQSPNLLPEQALSQPSSNNSVANPRKYKVAGRDGISEVDGTPIRLHKDIDTFLHQDENGNWVVSEAKTGRSLTSGGYPISKHAVDEARGLIDSMGAEAVNRRVNELSAPESKGVVISEAIHPGAGTRIQRGIRIGEAGKPEFFERQVAGAKTVARVEAQGAPDMSTVLPELKTLKEAKKSFMDLTNEYLGGQKSGQIKSVQTARDYNSKFGNLTESQKNQVIFAKDDPTYKVSDPKVREAVGELQKIYDDEWKYFTQQKGLKLGYQQDYYPREYKNIKTGAEITAAEYSLLQKYSGRQHGRTSSTLAEWKLITRDPAEGLQRYHNSLERAAAGQQYIKQLETEGLVVSSNEPVRGMKPIVAEGMQQNGMVYYARPEVADKLNNIFGSNEATGIFEKGLRGARKFNSFVQSFVLSGGVPNTPINSFGMMQLMKHGMALHPIQGAKAFMTGLSRKNATKFFDQHSPYLKMAAENGLDIRYDYSLKPNKGMVRIQKAVEEAAPSGVAKQSWEAMKQGWDELTNDATFGRFMPALEVLHFKGVYDGQIRKGVDPEVASKTAANATANFFGKNTMAKDATRSRTASDASGAFLFAPRFRESMVNFWAKNARVADPRGGFKNLRSPEYRDNVKFMVAAAATYAAMDSINMSLNGVHLQDNPDGKKDKLLIPGGDATGGKYIGIPFLPSIATVPRNVAGLVSNTLSGNFEEAGKNLGSFASMPVKTITEIFTNQDYFGGKIVDEDASGPEKLAQAASHAARSGMQPWMREGLNAMGQNLPEGVKKAVGIRKQSGVETASKALETPLRFYDPEYFRGGSDSFSDGTTANIRVKKDGKYVDVTSLPAHEQFEKLMEYNKGGGKITNASDSDWIDNQIKTIGTQAADSINSWLPADWPKLTANTRLTEAWASFERRKADGSISALKEASERKKLVKNAYIDMARPGSDVRDFMSLSTADKIAALEAGLISKETMDDIIGLDNLLYDKDLSSSLDVSKTLRNALGYSSPSRGSGRGRKASKPRAFSTVNITRNMAVSPSSLGTKKTVSIDPGKILAKSQVSIRKKK